MERDGNARVTPVERVDAETHLHRYCTEFGFRWDHRRASDGERMVEAIKGAEGKRLTYKRPVAW